jgi:tetratricopeptide (TPR) repeat protein
LLHAGKSHQAEVEFLRVCNQEDASYKTSARFSLGRLYASQNHHSLAVELLQQVIEDQSDFEEARLLLAQSQSELGLFKDSLINFHTSLTNQPQRSKEIKPQIALCLSRLGEHNLAIPLAQECLLEQGAEFHLLELLASLYMAAEEWDEALITLLELQKKTTNRPSLPIRSAGSTKTWTKPKPPKSTTSKPCASTPTCPRPTSVLAGCTTSATKKKWPWCSLKKLGTRAAGSRNDRPGRLGSPAAQPTARSPAPL